MKTTVIGMLLASCAAFGVAGEVKKMEFTPDPASNGLATPRGCNLADVDLPDNTVVYATGAYAGKETDFQIDQSGNTATRFDVVVNSPGNPVVLMLSAYEPSVWQVGWTAGTRIVAALVTGYHRQGVAGLPASTPLINSSHDNKGPCGSFYLSDSTLTELNPLARRALGRPVTMVYPSSNGKVVVGAPLPPKVEILTSTDVSLSAFRDPTAPLAGKPGLDAAVRKGILRVATVRDAQAWADALAKQVPPPDLPPVAGGKAKAPASAFYGGYVVLKPFTVPAGLYGAHSTSFYVPKGVPAPTGNLGHSTVYDHNHLSCTGSDCPR